MDKELQGKLVEILTSIQDGVGQAKDFALSQLPDIAQSYILYGRALYTLGFIGCVIALGALVWWCKWLYQFSQNRRDSFDDTVIMLTVFTGVGGSLALVGLITAITQCVSAGLLVWFAPKVWLLKELAHLIK